MELNVGEQCTFALCKRLGKTICVGRVKALPGIPSLSDFLPFLCDGCGQVFWYVFICEGPLHVVCTMPSVIATQVSAKSVSPKSDVTLHHRMRYRRYQIAETKQSFLRERV